MKKKEKIGICRTCLTNCYINQIAIPLFLKRPFEKNNTAQQIMECCSINVEEGDGYPEIICLMCYSKLKEFMQFKYVCQNSDRILRTCSKDYSNGFENCLNMLMFDETGPTSTSAIKTEEDEVTLGDSFDLNLNKMETNAFMYFKMKTNNNKKVRGKRKRKKTNEVTTENKVSTTMLLRRINKKTLKVNKQKSIDDKTNEIVDRDYDDDSDDNYEDDKRELVEKENDERIKDDEQGGKYCTTCKKTFNTHMEFNEHYSETHRNICEFCHREFIWKKLLRKHLLISHKDKCKNLSLDFEFSTDGKKNGENQLDTKYCSTCKKMFMTCEEFRQHYEVLHRNKCVYCAKEFIWKKLLKTHLESLHKETVPESFLERQCEECGKSFSNQKLFNYHKKTHKEYLCPYCGIGITHSSNYKIHVKRHTGEKPHVCNFCSKAFVSRRDLKTHQLQMHSNKREYLCDLCEKGFKLSHNLKMHKIRIHQLEKRNYFVCSECHGTFKSLQILKHHMLIHGDPQFKCDLCEKRFHHKKNLKVHMSSHNAVHAQQIEDVKPPPAIYKYPQTCVLQPPPPQITQHHHHHHHPLQQPSSLAFVHNFQI